MRGRVTGAHHPELDPVSRKATQEVLDSRKRPHAIAIEPHGREGLILQVLRRW